MIGIAQAFSASYREARVKFLEGASSAGWQIESHPHPLKGRDGEDLAMDVARSGPLDAQNLLILSSACHGVEGYCGSGVQVFAAHDADWLAHAQSRGVAVLCHPHPLYGGTMHNPVVFNCARALQEAGFPLYDDRADGKKVWRLVEGYQQKLAQGFTLSELAALYFSRNMLAFLGGAPLIAPVSSLPVPDRPKEASPEQTRQHARGEQEAGLRVRPLWHRQPRHARGPGGRPGARVREAARCESQGIALPGIEREGIAQLSLLETALWPLQGGKLRCMGSTTYKEYRQHFEKDQIGRAHV